jgi:metal-responsive CopG/Arc/MetJ family transcriptional regulator
MAETKSVSVRLELGLLARLNAFIGRQQTIGKPTRTEVMQAALMRFLDEEEGVSSSRSAGSAQASGSSNSAAEGGGQKGGPRGY